MKKSRVFCAFVSFFLVIYMIPSVAFATQESVQHSDDAQPTVSSGLDATVAYLGNQTLVDNVSAAILYERNTDTLMYMQNPDQKIYPSSLVKILTAFIATEEGKLEDVVTVREEVLNTVPYDAVTVELVAGEQMTLDDLLYCMMVGSGNDAAAVIADYICGSQPAFVEKMNSYAQRLGCTNSQFTNVHGLHDDSQFTTVRDMAKIIAAAMSNEHFVRYYTAPDCTVRATNQSEERYFSSGNFLISSDDVSIYYDERATGGRTGIANDGTRCFAANAESNDMELICVLAGAVSTFAENGNTVVYGGFKEATMLFDAGLNGYKAAQVLFDGQAVRQVSVINGANDVVLGCRSTVSAILPTDISRENLQYRYVDDYESLSAPVEMGSKISNVQIWYGGICIAQADLYAMNAVQSKMIQQPETGGSVFGVVLLVFFGAVLFLVLGAAVCLVSIRIYYKIRHMNKAGHSKRYRRYRRRSR